MEEKSEPLSLQSVGLKYGLLLGAVLILINTLINVLDIDPTGAVRWLQVPVYLAVVFLAHKNFKDSGDGFMRYGQGMSIAAWLGLVAAGLNTVFTYIYVSFLDPGLIEKMKDLQLEELQKQGMSDSEIDRVMEISSFAFTPIFITIMTFVFVFIFVLIAGLLVAFATQKKNENASF